MHAIQTEIPKPTSDDEFEDMCANVYGELFGDPAPQRNGRSGQGQFGVDVFVAPRAGGRIGIQSKRWLSGRLKIKDVRDEVDKADTAGASRIDRLIVATTADNDAVLVQAVNALSDERVAQGMFPVQINAWNDISRFIRSHDRLQMMYAPNAPGGVLYKVEETHRQVLEAVQRMSTMRGTDVALPAARDDSANKLVTSQLDGINDLLKTYRFKDAEEALARLESNLQMFDAHQQARWYVQRANCVWQRGQLKEAADDFIKASELYPDDEKIAAAGARGLLLREDAAGALEAARKALARWPQSLPVWLVYANALMVTGGKLRLNDAPPSLRTNADVLQTVAWARFKHDDLAGAVELSARAAKADGAGFFNHAAALGFALQKAVGTPSGFAFGAISAPDRNALANAVADFADRATRLWAVQADAAVDEAAWHLAMAHIALDDLDTALAVAKEARMRERMTGGLLRQEMEVFQRQGQGVEAVRLGREGIELLDPQGLALLADIAGHAGDVAAVEAVQARASASFASDQTLHDVVVSLRWRALWRAGRRDEATAEINAANLSQSDSFNRVASAARLLAGWEQAGEADALVNRAIELAGPKPVEEVQIGLAELLFSAHRFGQAIPLYLPLVRDGQYTELHNRLLYCYVRTGARNKAKALLATLPEGWTENEGTRQIAIEMAQGAGDFQLLERLADAEVRHAPDKAASWVFRVSVALRRLSLPALSDLIASLPQELTGTPRHLAQLASAEIRYGDRRKAMRRLYGMYRADLDSAEAASAYVMPMLSANAELPFMEAQLAVVAAGTTVTLVDDMGVQIVVAIDPSDVRVPIVGRFFSETSEEVARLLGTKVGDQVVVTGGLKHERTLRVTAIRSTYRHLHEQAQGVITGAIKSVEHIMSVPVPMKDGEPDFSFIQAELAKMTEHTTLVLDAYREGPLTLGLCGQMLGRSAIELVAGWSSEWPAMEFCAGTLDELTTAETLLNDKAGVYVVDLATLTELARLEGLKALQALPKVLVTTTTRDIVFTELDEAQNDQSVGRTLEYGGQLAYIPSTAADKARRVAFVQSIVDAITHHCEVVPAYGPEQPSEELVKAGEVLEPAEHASLLLAAERGAVLFSLDWRLRILAATLGVKGVWVQPVMRRGVFAGAISQITYAMSNVKQLLANRSFVSINAWDMAVMCLQGGAWLQVGMKRLKEYIATQGEQLGVIGSIEEFLLMQTKLATTWQALGELLVHLSEALFRRPDLSLAAEAVLMKSVEDVVRVAIGNGHPYTVISEMQGVRAEHLMKFLAEKVEKGKARALAGDIAQPVNLKVIYGSRVPRLIYGRVSLSAQEAQPTADAQEFPESSGSNPSGSTPEPDHAPE